MIAYLAILIGQLEDNTYSETVNQSILYTTEILYDINDDIHRRVWEMSWHAKRKIFVAGR